MSIKIFDINSFLKRSEFTHAELAEKIGSSVGLVSTWASKPQKASFDKCVKLLKLGMTFEEMFGTELTENTQAFLNKRPIENESDFNKKVGEAVIALVNSGVSNLKKES